MSIDELIPTDWVTLITGSPLSGKSYLAYEKMASVSGICLGRGVARNPILVADYSDVSQVRERLKQHGIDPDMVEVLSVGNSPVDWSPMRFSLAFHKNQLMRAVKSNSAKSLVVIDGLSRHMRGTEGWVDNSRDAGLFLGMLFDELATAGATVVCIEPKSDGPIYQAAYRLADSVVEAFVDDEGRYEAKLLKSVCVAQ